MHQKYKIFIISFFCILLLSISTSYALQSKVEERYFEPEETYSYENFIKNETFILETDLFYQEDYDKMINDNLEGYVNDKIILNNGEVINQYYTIIQLHDTPQDLIDEGYFEELIELKPYNVPENNIFTIDSKEIKDFEIEYLTKDEYNNIK